jgi:hypothetical protein
MTIRGLREAAKTERIDNLEKIVADLDEFERVLNGARNMGWAGIWQWISKVRRSKTPGGH